MAEGQRSSQTPTLKELNKHVIKYAAPQWEDLGIELDIDDNGSKLDEFKVQRGGDEAKCCLNVLKAWLQGAGEEPKTWEVLLNCLREIRANEAVQSIEANILKCCPPQVAATATAVVSAPSEQRESPSKTYNEQPTEVENKQALPNKTDDQPQETPHTQQPDHPVSANVPGASAHKEPLLMNEQQTESGEDEMKSEWPLQQFAGLQLQEVEESEQTHMKSPSKEYSLVPVTPQAHSRRLDFSLKLEPPKQVRMYQWELAEPGINGENHIVCAPTGTGKTLVGGLVISHHLQMRNGKGRVIFMVNTRPLAQQQAKELQKLIPGSMVACCTGDDGMGITIKTTLPENDIVVCTAGKLLNELQDSHIDLKEITLLVIDECHHTQKGTPHAKVMEKYLEEKQQGRGYRLPQVMGLTASPGAGDNRMLELDKTIDHLVSLCALMDATSGVKKVTKNTEELDRCTNKPTFTLKVLNRRESSEPFIACIVTEMSALEQFVGLECPFDRWSQEYETTVQQRKQPLELSLDPTNRDQISTLELLCCYSQVLNFYMDLTCEDAISILNEFDKLPPPEQATNIEKQLIEGLKRVKQNLALMPNVENPLLQAVEGIICNQFLQKPDSKGLFFVRTKKHAYSICGWIKSLSADLKIQPHVITGHGRETTPGGMTQVEQEQAIKSFHEGKYNLLVATSVAEEGLDVPACNLVIRFQHVSNEIAKVQTMGRARASESEGFTILASNSKKKYQEMRNDELELLVQEALQYFPTGAHLDEKLTEKQEQIMRGRAMKNTLAFIKHKRQQAARAATSTAAIRLKCRRCKAFACNGEDVYKVEGTHHVVVNKEFKDESMKKKPHPNPKQMSKDSKMYKGHKIYCAQCDRDWGVMCTWPEEGFELPVLKCKSFIFEVNNSPRIVRKWTDAPFEPSPISSLPEYQALGDDD